jgi:hypothetical protein
MEDFLDTAIVKKERMEEEDKKRIISVSIDPDLYFRLINLRSKSKISISQMVNCSLKQTLPYMEKKLESFDMTSMEDLFNGQD